jgi:predicted O-linked N-acetylglucosamine transferase (SPINDLY family)
MLKDRAFSDAGARAWTLGRFAREGIPPERLDLQPRISASRDHLAMYNNIDIALDPFPYCGVTTTCEALWMGVPVVTLAEDAFVSRMGLTLLEAAGHPEWIAFDEDGYIQIVLALAADPALRARLRRSLRQEMRSSRLTDERGFTRNLEAAYRDMWRRWCAQATPNG